MAVIHNQYGQPLLEVESKYPGTFPTPTIKGNEAWLLARLAEVWSDHHGEPVDETFRAAVLQEMSRNQYFNSAVVDLQIHERRLASVTFRHGLEQTSLMV